MLVKSTDWRLMALFHRSCLLEHKAGGQAGGKERVVRAGQGAGVDGYCYSKHEEVLLYPEIVLLHLLPLLHSPLPTTSI